MPTYEYGCTKCGKQFEYFQKITEKPKSKCEACGGKLERLISGGNFILKGGGWYKDLYSSSKPSSSSSSSSDSSTKKSDKKKGE